ncbi:MipA/OmpV family protein [Thalassotalea marina]|uniref:MipA/OmpV family protein n=1 Tax=Thalassotalea marina TaxID=1673741 RepID=UPI0016736920|nr:MipA/OmpV family protein [Thalassotalea marina]
MKFPRFYLFIALFCAASQAVADTSTVEQDGEIYAPVNQWQFSVALGGGVITNPLHGGKNIPLIVLPYIHYYGENFFIENNVLGYSSYQSDTLVISAISQLNKENLYFRDWQPEHLFTPFSGADHWIGPSTEETKRISKNDISKRKWAIDGGLQINWFVSPQSEIKFKLLHDLNNVYKGLNSSLSFHHNVSFDSTPKLRARVGVGIDWQSQNLSQYYYGLNEKDAISHSQLYRAHSGFNPFVSISANYELAKRWQLQGTIKHQWLGSHIAKSPLMQDDQVSSAFIGVVYAF